MMIQGMDCETDMIGVGPMRLLILDIDNTLFDWFEFWSRSFGAMITAVTEAADISEERLLAEIRAVHLKHGTSEYAFVLNEVPCISALGAEKRDEVIRAGRAAFRAARADSERLYPGVLDTLNAIKRTGCKIAAYTESQLFYTSRRLVRFGLDGVLDALYCAEDHDIPDDVDLAKLRSGAPSEYALQKTRTILLPRDLRKPNPEIVIRILNDLGVPASSALYVGDSLFKDIAMAQDAGVQDAYAAYGQSMDREGYDLLRKVSHWSDAHIAKEKSTAIQDISPSISLQQFSDILTDFSFGGP